ncbi:hypothetical protein CsSME_00015781 [Camellia sinensis var. sinensis]
MRWYTMSESKPPPPQLLKQQSWSPDIHRQETWSRRKDNHKLRRRLLRRTKSVTDDDFDELKACFELGFGFDSDSPDSDPKLSDAFPALELYYAVNKQYNNHHGGLSRSSSSASTLISDSDSSSLPIESPRSSTSTTTIFDSGDDPETMKTRLRQWAQVVGCVVRQSSPN